MTDKPFLALEDVHAFLDVARAGGFAAAASRIGIAKSILSRRVAKLEDRLGAELLIRSASGAKPSEVGRAYLARMDDVVARIEMAEEEVNAIAGAVSGPIRITAPLSFGTRHLGPILAEFASTHPDIDLDIVLDDRAVDIIAEGFDFALRIGHLKDSALIARRITPVKVLVVAAPAYLAQYGTPIVPDELRQHQVLLYGNIAQADQWRFELEGKETPISVSGRIRSNNGDILLEAAKAGHGLVVLPDFIANEALDEGSIVPVLEDHAMPAAGMFLVYPEGRMKITRFKTLSDHLFERLAKID